MGIGHPFRQTFVILLLDIFSQGTIQQKLLQFLLFQRLCSLHTQMCSRKSLLNRTSVKYFLISLAHTREGCWLGNILINSCFCSVKIAVVLLTSIECAVIYPDSCCTTEAHVINILLLELQNYYLIMENEDLFYYSDIYLHQYRHPPLFIIIAKIVVKCLCRILIKNSNFIVAIKRLHFLFRLGQVATNK